MVSLCYFLVLFVLYMTKTFIYLSSFLWVYTMVVKSGSVDGDRTRNRGCFRERGFLKSYNKKCSKKGQITVFIIVGILILFTTAGILYFTKTVTTQKLETAKEPTISAVPVEFQPIQQYTENCLLQEGKSGLVLLGGQGGYIYPDVVGKFSTGVLSGGTGGATDMTNADGITLGAAHVPYWYYNVKPNVNPEVVFSSLRPKLYAKEDDVMSVESQLGRYVKEKLDECLQSYGAFAGEGFRVEKQESEGVMEVEARVAENSVNFWLKMPLRVTKAGNTIEMNEFYVKIPLQLKRFYDVASEVAQTEQNFSFLERDAMDMIVTYSGVDMKKLPPTQAVTFDAIPSVYWLEKDVALNVKSLLTSHVPLIRYYGADNFYRFDYLNGNTNKGSNNGVQESSGVKEGAVADLSGLYQKNYDDMILPLDSGKGLDVTFDYFNWVPYVDLNDKGGKIEASSAGASVMQFQFHTNSYYTTYDLSYPVLVTLRDTKAFDGEGYTFAFALESNIRNNEVVKSGYIQPPPVVAQGKSLVCDEDKRGTQPIVTQVVDSSNLKPLEAVQIGYSIPQDTDCVIGQTDNLGSLDESYPAVYGGVVSFAKEGYLTSFYPVDTYQFKNRRGVIGNAFAGLNDKVVPLHKIKTINVSVKKKMMEKCVGETGANIKQGAIAVSAVTGVGGVAEATITTGEKARCFTQGLFGNVSAPLYSYTPELLDRVHSWVFVDSARALDVKESATIILTRVADLLPGVSSDDFVATATVTGNEMSSVDLVPGIYRVDGLLSTTQEIIIPQEERCSEGVVEAIACTDVNGCCNTFDEQKLDKLLEGQVQWDTPGMYLAITPDQLYGSQQITFYVVGFDEANVPQQEHIRVLEDLQVMGQLGNISRTLRGNLEPSFQ